MTPRRQTTHINSTIVPAITSRNRCHVNSCSSSSVCATTYVPCPFQHKSMWYARPAAAVCGITPAALAVLCLELADLSGSRDPVRRLQTGRVAIMMLHPKSYRSNGRVSSPQAYGTAQYCLLSRLFCFTFIFRVLMSVSSG